MLQIIMQANTPLWSPTTEQIESSEVVKFIKTINLQHAQNIVTQHELYQFSIDHNQQFWQSFLEFSGIQLQTKGTQILETNPKMLACRWFSDSALNFTENLLAYAKNTPTNIALISCCEQQPAKYLTYAELAQQVNALRHWLKQFGIQPGDRVAAVTSNSYEAIVGILATAAEGAIWSSCSPDFGVSGILDRFQQIEPRLLLATCGYFYKEKYFDQSEKLTILSKQLPSLEGLVLFNVDKQPTKLANLKLPTYNLQEIINTHQTADELAYSAFPFNHPLYIMFSSGTTGKPKCIVHGAGGTLLEHQKELKLHCDLKAEETIYYNTTCGWMMWNWLVSALAVGSSVVLYDGFPLLNNGQILFDLIERERINIFGTSAGFLSAIAKNNLEPIKSHNLNRLRTILSTGSVLAPEQFDYVYNSISSNVQLCSISGGTDIIGCFALGSPILPVLRGQLQCRSLGYAVEIFDSQGQAINNQAGELVCTKPFPSMPIKFWNDPNHDLYRKAYFNKFNNIWCHGDFAEITKENGLIIYGRSDATLNPQGVRIGTAEIYRQLENFNQIELALVTSRIVKNEEEVVLFLKLKAGVALDQEFVNQIKQNIKQNASPRHVPQHIFQVKDIPVTRSGKVSELTVKRIINSQPVDNTEALANSECLVEFESYRS